MRTFLLAAAASLPCTGPPVDTDTDASGADTSQGTVETDAPSSDAVDSDAADSDVPDSDRTDSDLATDVVPVDTDDTDLRDDTSLVPGGEDCDNGMDDDGDGLFDCRDAECLSAPGCGESDCDNRRDDDGDGAVDCVDDDCWGRGCAYTAVTVERGRVYAYDRFTSSFASCSGMTPGGHLQASHRWQLEDAAGRAVVHSTQDAVVSSCAWTVDEARSWTQDLRESGLAWWTVDGTRDRSVTAPGCPSLRLGDVFPPLLEPGAPTLRHRPAVISEAPPWASFDSYAYRLTPQQRTLAWAEGSRVPGRAHSSVWIDRRTSCVVDEYTVSGVLHTVESCRCTSRGNSHVTSTTWHDVHTPAPVAVPRLAY